MTTHTPPTGWMPEREANEALGLNRRYGLLNRRRAGSPTPDHVRVGGRYFYDPASVAEFDPWKARRESHRDQEPSYSAVHRRVRTEYGPARDHQCIACDAPAAHWAYAGDPVHARIEFRGKDAGLPYSIDTLAYVPACRPHAAELDLHPLRRKRTH